MAAATPSFKEELALLPMLKGESNFPMWTKRLRSFLKSKDLWSVVIADPGPNPTARIKKQMAEAGYAITMRIADFIHNGLVTEENEDNGYLIWKDVKDTYARYTTHRYTKCMTNWHAIKYEGKMLPFIRDIQDSLDAFASIAHPMPSKDVCSVIVSKLSHTRRALTDSFVFNADIMQNHLLLIARLKDVAEEEEEEPKRKERSAVALNNTRTRPPSGCRNGKHHPDATHPEATCWSLHPEMRPIRKPRQNPSQHHTSAPSNSVNSSAIPPVASQFEKPAFSHITTVIMLSVTPQTLPVVLDSGASHHMFNNMDFFTDTHACNTPISTGKNSADLVATLEGTASIMDSTGKIIQLPGSLYVPGLRLYHPSR
ncbi:uncharacterized protein PGTG_19912 [Puccinia graminis f. sp. tritici CRL 75-36-700-3]|uniref:Retrovirus-related Pol polyprotein from transposon TNT 1-94-like beta-barrel domain-containing protein n=1 Tax=Puccinia graminis f. sp. tritici (strain CRL 75-36-700-3 / race SCCL) TaxID=418459 RepID=E3LBE8_PUCGT|nr:uncharacterized protein PGTG_19912 [Puccinia graminis f. sp. tritici CRL 75-36-700-3]EFP93873.1 hypothetical protein PGTG_19912 [Puccinia graminis f. sp. tritici CRL 75-36-700-3]